MARRFILACCSLLLALSAPLAFAAGWGLDDVEAQARERAARPWAPVPRQEALSSSYDAWRSLRFRPDRALWRGDALNFRAQFFPAGGFFTRPVEIFEVQPDGQVRPLPITRGHFVQGDAAPTEDPAPMPLAGLRLLNPLNRTEHFDEVISFIGASYFRALGSGQQYGSSARGLALDTTGGAREEFPEFVRFWLERPAPGATRITLYALLDSPRASGAYRFEVQPGLRTQVDVTARIYLRGAITTLGIAPLTSMFYGGENQPPEGDFRPEIHDADGLQVATGAGEWLWRPLMRPRQPFVTSFAMSALRGFGLMQRDRRFASYEDLEAHYHRRPSVWVEPLGDWGPGRVELLQLPAKNESEDNIVAFWVPATAPMAGQPIALAWRLHWAGDNAPGPTLGRVLQTRTGFGYHEQAPPEDRLQFHIDFAGGALQGLPADAAVRAVASGDANSRVLATRAEPNPVTGGWRLSLDVQRLARNKTLELRAVLRLDGAAPSDAPLTETWTYALSPEPSP